ncbi:hypothetical protein [Promicromonospora sp. MEB111]|uniref:hypothetical protein n=1 Tax=Promicromonospora sp. MEB111 TaxID=3040301 RepID=UPI00254D3A30|nr:hypothetical protein [Promicromonospora sp. MEB111]
MYEPMEGQALDGPGVLDGDGALAAPSPVDVAFAALLDGLFTGPRVTYAPVREAPTYYGGHHQAEQRQGGRRHRRFVLRAGTDLDDPRLDDPR